MKKLNLLLILGLFSLTFTACNSTQKVTKETTTQRTAQTRGFSNAKRPRDNAICTNCRAVFKLSQAKQKTTNGHSYIECPVCHHNYLEKAI